MAEYIECRNCDSPYCDGCNIHSLTTMLRNGKFNCLMNNNHSINCSADVVEVVRCKDCKFNGDETESVDLIACLYFMTEMKPDDFCSYGERKCEE